MLEHLIIKEREGCAHSQKLDIQDIQKNVDGDKWEIINGIHGYKEVKQKDKQA